VQAPKHFHQVVSGHRQLDALAPVVLAPAEVLEKPKVFGELRTEPLGFDKVLLALEEVEQIAYGAEVVADQLVEPLALVAVDRDRGLGHGAPPLGRAPKTAAMPP
jgi:hypothetical protein